MRSTFADNPQTSAHPVFESIVYRSAAMSAVLGDIRRIAPIDVSVLLLGENGTGKELLAQAIHDLSRRAKNPFIAVN
jgi:transcriptional regulator with PAS, ATPase and Fis domain